MNNAHDIPDFAPSISYNVVRCRQLEGTYPGDPQTGCWPITSLRVMRGWGYVPDNAWPKSALRSWPPPEPPGMDEIAKQNRIFRYQRIRSAQECLEAVRTRNPVMAAFEVTAEWFDAVDGVIHLPREDSPLIGSHQVTIVGADQVFTVMNGSEQRRFLFENSWSSDWGINGHGFMTWEFFNRWLIEAWTFDSVSPEGVGQSEVHFTAPGIVSPVQYIAAINDPAGDERIAWTLVTPRQDFLDVEELFVKPEYRRKGHGSKLLTSLRDLSRRQGVPLRFLIPFADCESENFLVVQRMLTQIGYRVEVSRVRWAPYIGILSAAPGARPHFPQKPTLAGPQPGSKGELQRKGRERVGVFDSQFQNVTESVFKQHEELLRRLS